MKSGTARAMRIIIADDHTYLMSGLSMAIVDRGLDVVAQINAADEIVGAYERLRPDVLVLDIRFGKALTGFDVARALLKKFPDARIVFISQFDQEGLIKEAYRIGGKAFLTKDCDVQDLVDAINRASRGEIYFLANIAERIARSAVQGDHSPQSVLDERELQIFVLMAQGLTNAEIAERLDLSAKTISNESQVIKDKLGMHRQADIARLAIGHHLIEPLV